MLTQFVETYSSGLTYQFRRMTILSSHIFEALSVHHANHNVHYMDSTPKGQHQTESQNEIGEGNEGKAANLGRFKMRVQKTLAQFLRFIQIFNGD